MKTVRSSELPLDLCLELANTVDWHLADDPGERLPDGAALRAWAREHGLPVPSDPAAALSRARALREAVFAVFAALARGERPAPADASTLETEVRDALGALRLVPGDGAWDYAWEADGSADALLRPVAWSAGELLRSPAELARLRLCANDPCGWLFLDRSRSRTRRWCDMSACGNRAKARRHYARTRASRITSS